jgi:hypothetical protein
MPFLPGSLPNRQIRQKVRSLAAFSDCGFAKIIQARKGYIYIGRKYGQGNKKHFDEKSSNPNQSSKRATKHFAGISISDSSS